MNKFEIDENSWTFIWNKWLSFWVFSVKPYDYPKDFCSYWRHTLLWSPIALVLILLLIGFVIVAGYAVGYSIIYEPKAFFIAVGSMLVILPAVLGFIVVMDKYWPQSWSEAIANFFSYIFKPIGMMFVFVFMKIYELFMFLGKFLPEKKQSDKKVERKPSMLKTRYDAWKEKYCPMVDYKFLDKNSEKVSPEI